MKRSHLEGWTGNPILRRRTLRDLFVRLLAEPKAIEHYRGHYNALRYGWHHGLIEDGGRRLTPRGRELATLVSRAYRGDLVAFDDDNGAKAVNAVRRRLSWLKRHS